MAIVSGPSCQEMSACPGSIRGHLDSCRSQVARRGFCVSACVVSCCPKEERKLISEHFYSLLEVFVCLYKQYLFILQYILVL